MRRRQIEVITYRRVTIIGELPGESNTALSVPTTKPTGEEEQNEFSSAQSCGLTGRLAKSGFLELCVETPSPSLEVFIYGSGSLKEI